MKKFLFIIAVLFLSANAFSQNAGSQLTITPFNNEMWSIGSLQAPTIQVAMKDEQVAYRHSSTVSDILTDGKIPVSMDSITSNVKSVALGRGYTFYGRIWSTRITDGFPRVQIAGRDSADITVYYRWVGWTANTYSVGAWTQWGNTVALRRPTNLRDTLLHVPSSKLWEKTAGTDTTGFIHKETGWIQYKYYVLPANACSNHPLMETCQGAFKNHVGNNKFQRSWSGETYLTFRKEGK
jgi:hypothetical protein